MIIKYPYVSEKASRDLEFDGKLQFIIDLKASKEQVAKELERMFDKKVSNVQTLLTMKGKKKAIVTFEDEKAGEEILSRLGVM
ncbi:50S ribosomal protein L23 [Methanomicrobium antiquum]|uniref:Large ribosomal subunit protein uL23 n=1 Tax=Methanomicrobium antiquum TaxID=487686 RepID=A0AAF0FN53_9EURY|nr:50S ribosomal protein L23 [Methanomicrobium antiquum]MDD3977022.1 50S ribosomal protein L23 [Methanomicrobium sp.]WFN37368.1 50S ribosomal protein L23 [Methanomicrobium antiquum]